MRDKKIIEAYIDVSKETGKRGTREYLWMQKTFGGYRIANVPYHSRRLAFDDIVRVDDETREILSVHHRSGYRNGMIRYSASFERITRALEHHGIIAEDLCRGLTAVAIPQDTTKERFDLIVKTIPGLNGGELREIEPFANP